MIFEPVDGSGNRISNTDADKKKNCSRECVDGKDVCTGTSGWIRVVGGNGISEAMEEKAQVDTE